MASINISDLRPVSSERKDFVLEELGNKANAAVRGGFWCGRYWCEYA